MKNLALKIAKILKKKFYFKYINSPLGGTKLRYPSIDKIKKIGFKPKYNLINGLKKTIKSYK
jgi:nucleoside-diphosphate-sugar epimerase